MIWLHRYLDDALIELRLIDRVDHYLQVQWEVLRGINSDVTSRLIGFLSIAHTMYKDLVVHIVAEVLYQTHLFKVSATYKKKQPIFEKMCKDFCICLQRMDAEVVRRFCLMAKLAVLPPNEDIIEYGDFVRRMYIIRRGFVDVSLAFKTRNGV